MKILISANTSWYVYNFRGKLIERLLKNGYQVVIAAPEDSYTSRIKAKGCAFEVVKMDPNGTSPRRDFALYRRFRQILRHQKPDMVFSYTIKCNIFLSLAARATKTPVAPNVSGLGTAFLSDGWVNRIVQLLYRRAFRHPRTVFFQNPDDQQMFLDLGLVRREQARLLPGSGVDLVRFAPHPMPDGQEVTFLLVARMLWDKGVGEYVEAARRIRRHYPNARFQLLGGVDANNSRAIPQEKIEEWRAEGVVEYLGTTGDVRPYIAQAHCVVLPSYREGTPRSLLEAAAMARPVITTDAPGCRNVVEDGVSGYLCALRDSAELEGVVRKFLALSMPQWAAMGQAGRQKMEREYDEAIVLEAYLDEIRKLS